MITKSNNDLTSIDFQKGEVLLVNKHLRCSSAQLLNKIKKIFNIKKVGHAGTLDPMATGLMILCTGKATREIKHFQNLTKEYTGKIYLGKTTPSMDLETSPTNDKSIDHLTFELLKEKAKLFVGEIEQIPPVFSAVRINGKRAYNLARKGKEVVLKPRIVTINRFDVFDFVPPFLSFIVNCSKGTYIRKLVSDYGEALGCGAFLFELQRTKIGDYSVEDALSLEELKMLLNNRNN